MATKPPTSGGLWIQHVSRKIPRDFPAGSGIINPKSPAAPAALLCPALETTLPRPLETCHCPWGCPAPWITQMVKWSTTKGSSQHKAHVN